MINVHLIFNAHLDPIWLWPWQAGLDSALATCRSACDRLDAHPDITFTRGEAWVYYYIERTDPALFERISAHIKAGRWEIVGGWWIQPDCNQPSGFGMQKQIAIGREYFQSRFGIYPKTGYNVDSFGHAATLPGYMHEVGQTNYIMMRPQEHEKALPGRVFRWRGYEDGPEVTTFRIAASYNSNGGMSYDHIHRSMTELPEGIQDTMCFVGVGDHGGGPSEADIAWIHEHQDQVPGCRLVPSSPTKFFEAIAPQIDKLPQVVGELQMHAIGCYTTQRSVKVGIRNAEHALYQAQLVAPKEDAPQLRQGWEYTCFHHFHDTMGGTCLPSAYPEVDHQLGYAQAAASESMSLELRRRMNALPDCVDQRLVFWNPSDTPFDGLVEAEPWIGWQHWENHWQLHDENDKPVVYQRFASEAFFVDMPRVMLRLQAEPGQLRVLRVDRNPENASAISKPLAETAFPEIASQVRLDLIEDFSDTWSHGLDRYGETGTSIQWHSEPTLIDDGSIMKSWIQEGTIGESWVRAEWRVYADSPCAQLKLLVNWHETRKLLKLVLPTALAADRTDGIMGGRLVRPNDGREIPLRDWMFLTTKDGKATGVVAPDVYAADGNQERVRLTLLRSSIMAHHDPNKGDAPRIIIADQGQHEFRFEFWMDGSVTPDILDQQGLQLQRPLLFADLTRGMRSEYGWV